MESIKNSTYNKICIEKYVHLSSTNICLIYYMQDLLKHFILYIMTMVMNTNKQIKFYNSLT